jgi:FMN-dependent NADH-azoreductase
MKSTPAGKVGMLRDRPVFIGVTSGGVFTGDRANQPDFLTPYLSLAFSSIGLKTLQFLPVQAAAFLDRDQAALARDRALEEIDRTVIYAVVPGNPLSVLVGGLVGITEQLDTRVAEEGCRAP